jgi:hypothetical protein
MQWGCGETPAFEAGRTSGSPHPQARGHRCGDPTQPVVIEVAVVRAVLRQIDQPLLDDHRDRVPVTADQVLRHQREKDEVLAAFAAHKDEVTAGAR